MHFAHGEIMEAKGKIRGRMGIGQLFEPQPVEANGRRSYVTGTPISGFHNPWTAACCNHVVADTVNLMQGTVALQYNAAHGSRLAIPIGLSTAPIRSPGASENGNNRSYIARP
jgi:hypothetical protein